MIQWKTSFHFASNLLYKFYQNVTNGVVLLSTLNDLIW